MIALRWLVPQQIVWMTVTGEPTADEVIAALADLREYLVQDTLFVHVLLDDQGTSGPPPNMLKLQTAVRQTFAGTKIGWFVMLHDKHPLVDFFAAVLSQLLNIRYRSIPTMEEALAFLQQQDATLPDLGSIQLPERYA